MTTRNNSNVSSQSTNNSSGLGKLNLDYRFESVGLWALWVITRIVYNMTPRRELGYAPRSFIERRVETLRYEKSLLEI